jgi:hypothetical protein
MFADVNSERTQEKNQRNHIEHDGVLRVRRRRRNRNRNGRTRRNPTARKVIYRTDELNDHLSGLFQGKIGTFAKELAENISEFPEPSGRRYFGDVDAQRHHV